MKAFLNKYFLFGIGLYLIQIYTKLNHIATPEWVSNYFADILCMPLLLHATQTTLRIIKRNNTIVLSIPMILFTLIYVSVVFEFYLPKTSPKYTSDLWDIAYYALGTLGYIFFTKFRKSSGSFSLNQNLSQNHNQ